MEPAKFENFHVLLEYFFIYKEKCDKNKGEFAGLLEIINNSNIN